MDKAHLLWLQLLMALVLVLPPPLAAQSLPPPEYDREPARVDVSFSSGYLTPTDWSDLVVLGSVSPITGAFQQVLVQNLRVEPSTAFHGNVTYWRGRYGFRAHGGYSSSCVAVGRRCGEPALIAPEPADVDVRTWFYDIGGAIGLLDYTPHRWVWPYVFLGFGGATYDLERSISPPLLNFIEQVPDRPADERLIIVAEDGRQFLVAVNQLGLETRPAFHFGFATDFRIPMGPGGVGLRLEVSDYVTTSPVGLQIAEVRAGGAALHREQVQFGPVHNVRASVGVVLHFGR